MKRWTYNLFEAMRRLGVKDARQPALIDEAVLPALVVGDVSHLASPVLAPMAWAGGYQGGAAGEYTAFQIHGRSAGGCLVRQVHFGRRAAGPVIWTIEAADPLAADPLGTTLTNYDMAPTSSACLAQMGTSTVALGTDAPRHYAANGQAGAIFEGIYVPRNYWFTLQSGTVNNPMDGGLLFQDVVVPPAEA